MKIGIFGGSFNPPHKMHKKIANDLISLGYLDKVIFVPTGTKYEYKNNLIDNKHRLKMLEAMCQKNKNLFVSNYELQDIPIYTYETLDHFKKKYSKDEIYFICGTDNLSYIDKWKRGDYILKNYSLLVIERNTNKTNPILEKLSKYRSHITITKIKEDSISSTTIREKIKDGNLDEINQYLDKEVLNYIKEKNLYNFKIKST